MVEKKASDLFFAPYTPAKIKIEGKIMPVNKLEMTPKMVKQAAIELMDDDQLEQFYKELEIDFAISEPGLGRFRVNVFHQRGNISMVLRYITNELPNLDELGMPEQLKELTMLRRGLILMVGATGAGKSTTLAAMIDYRNEKTSSHIITIEDPIEFVHNHKKCLVNQRELGSDTESFPSALKYVLRQDPDVILIGEMRDLETIAAALTIAETGHLALATLHTNSTAESVNRIVDAFPAHQQGQIRAQLAFTLEGVVTQALLPRANGKGRVAAAEIMLATQAIRTLIRDDKIHQIYSALQTGKKLGMQTMNDSLHQLYMQGDVAIGECLRVSSDPAELRRMLGELEGGEAGGSGPRKGEVKRPGAATARR